MKKLLIVSIISFFAVQFGYSQGAHFGLKAGLTYTSFSGDDVPDSSGVSPKIGAQFGIALNSVVSDYFWLKHDLIGVIKGANYEIGSTKASTNLVYIVANPISPAFHFEGAQVYAGPQVGLLILRQDIFDGDDVTADDPLDGMNIVDLGLIVGAEYEFPFGLNVGLSYTKGFLSIYDPEQVDLDVKNDSWAVTVGYTFGKDK